MRVEIVTDTQYTDTQRGYHDRVTTVTFKYTASAGASRYTEAKEKEIVDALTSGHWMWYTDRGSRKNEDGTTTYTRQYGYDSGD